VCVTVLVMVGIRSGAGDSIPVGALHHAPRADDLARACAAVRDICFNIRPEQWVAPTPCSEWDVRQLVAHLTRMNRVFVALLNNEPIPRPPAVLTDEDAIGAFEIRPRRCKLRSTGRVPAAREQVVKPDLE